MRLLPEMEAEIKDRVALIGLGSNLGESERILNVAGARLRVYGEVRSSRLWRTRPVDCAADAADFVNQVVRLDLGGAAARLAPSAKELLHALQALEAEFGRRSTERGSARFLDLDLLSLADEQYSDSELTLPHPRALLRHFVLHPAAEVAPDYVWPGTTKTVRELAAALPASNWGEQLS